MLNDALRVLPWYRGVLNGKWEDGGRPLLTARGYGKHTTSYHDETLQQSMIVRETLLTKEKLFPMLIELVHATAKLERRLNEAPSMLSLFGQEKVNTLSLPREGSGIGFAKVARSIRNLLRNSLLTNNAVFS